VPLRERRTVDGLDGCGYRVPDDVSAISMDDLPQGRLSTIRR
jgi:hypothetical protein